MSDRRSERGDATMQLCGRVLRVDHGVLYLLGGDDDLASVRVRDTAALRPGDLVAVPVSEAQRAAVRALEQQRPDGTFARTLDARGPVTLVRRPTRDPFAEGAETHRLVARGGLARLRLRAELVAALRAFFVERNYLEVETPVAVPSPGLDLHLDAFAVARREHGGEPFAYLSTSPEYQMKRLLAGGVARCVQFARCFRDEEYGTRHEPEFTMLEWYRAWERFDALLEETEALVQRAAQRCRRPGVFTVDGRTPCDARGAFERLTVREAFARYAPEFGDPVALCARDEGAFFDALVARVEPRLGLERPTFLTRYPASLASLAALDPQDPSVCLRTELYVCGVELCNGFEELTDPEEQRARFRADQRARAACGKPVYPIDERLLAALEEGMPPSVGNALGLDRLVALVAGTERIADVLAVPFARR